MHVKSVILLWKKVMYTYITRGEQGTVGLSHVHVVVVILELWIKTKESTLSLLVSIISSAKQALPASIKDTCQSNRLSHSALNVYTLRVNPFLYVHEGILPPCHYCDTMRGMREAQANSNWGNENLVWLYSSYGMAIKAMFASQSEVSRCGGRLLT